MNETVKFGLEDIVNYINDENAELAIMKVDFLSTRENSHKINITEEILRRDASTILGKWLIAQMNMLKTDVKAHEVEQNIFGYFPTDQEIQFNEKNGAIVATANAVVSKLYAKQFYELFTKDNFRNASVEMTVLNQRENENGYLDIDGFNITGCTVLGKRINGSCPDANVEIIQFSEENAKEFYSNYKKELTNKIDKEEKVSMSMDEKEKEIDTQELDESKLEDKVDFVEPKDDEEKETTNKLEDDDSKDSDDDKDNDSDDKDDDENKEKMSKEESEVKEESEKMADKKESEEKNTKEEPKANDEKAKLAKELADANEKMAKMQDELNELKSFKLQTEEKERNIFVNNFLASIKERVSVEDYAKFEAESKECKFENLTNWSNGILANIAKDMLQFEENKESHLRMSVENKSKEKGLWDRL